MCAPMPASTPPPSKNSPSAKRIRTTIITTCSARAIWLLRLTMVASADVLFRLFHEEGVRIYSPTHIHFKCRCTRERVIDILRTIPRPELDDICKKEGHVEITCEFCSQKYTFAAKDLDIIYKER